MPEKHASFGGARFAGREENAVGCQFKAGFYRHSALTLSTNMTFLLGGRVILIECVPTTPASPSIMLVV